MLSAGYMVTRSQMDTFSKKRPEYALASTPEKKCLNVASIVSNYYVSCPTVGKMPTYGELTLIKFAQISVRNNDSQSRSMRVGIKVFGSADPISWLGYQSIGIGETYTFVFENLVTGTSYAVYFQESTNTQTMYSFVNNAYVSTLTGYGYIQSTLIVGGEQQCNKKIMLYVSSMNISIRAISQSPMNVRLWGVTFDQSAYATTDHLFENVPFADTFSFEVSGVSATGGYVVGAECQPTPQNFDPIYNDESGCEYEFNTGTTLGTDYYEITVTIP